MGINWTMLHFFKAPNLMTWHKFLSPFHKVCHEHEWTLQGNCLPWVTQRPRLGEAPLSCRVTSLNMQKRVPRDLPLAIKSFTPQNGPHYSVHRPLAKPNYHSHLQITGGCHLSTGLGKIRYVWTFANPHWNQLEWHYMLYKLWSNS